MLQLELLFPLAVQMRAFDFFALIRYLQPLPPFPSVKKIRRKVRP